MNEMILGNSVMSYVLAVVIFSLTIGVLAVLKNFVLRKLIQLAGKTDTDLDDLAVGLIAKIRPFEYLLAAFFISIRHLDRSTGFDKAFLLLMLLVFTYRAVTIIQDIVSYLINKIAVQRSLSESARASVVQSAQIILKTILWIASALFVLANMGVNVSAFLAGLGIGGVAVALAAQAILGDIFNFFVILLDKPFMVGDFIISDKVVGTVEHIGLKSVRIRSLSGELIFMSNSKLLGQELKNYKNMSKRRVLFKTTVTYQTSLEKVKHIPLMIKDIIARLPKTAFERSNLTNLGDFSIDFETVYYVESPDYNVYMNVHEQVLLLIMDKFAREGIEFAYPTQTLFVNKQG